MTEIEQKYIKHQLLEHRKKFGQFYTLDKIANFMIRWILEINPKTVYDPAFGMGAFFNEFRILKNDISCFYGKEIDKESYEFYLANTPRYSDLDLQNKNYFDSWNEKYDAIVCNPPYLKFQKFENKKQVLKTLSSFINEKVSGYTNTASAFLLKSISELNDGGRLA